MTYLLTDTAQSASFCHRRRWGALHGPTLIGDGVGNRRHSCHNTWGTVLRRRRCQLRCVMPCGGGGISSRATKDAHGPYGLRCPALDHSQCGLHDRSHDQQPRGSVPAPRFAPQHETPLFVRGRKVREQVPATISCEIGLRLLASEGALPLAAELRYDVADPYAVEALFDTGADSPVRWVFARDLLSDGLARTAGEGDVVVRPALDEDGSAAVHLVLASPDGRAMLEANSEELREFLDQTYVVVPRGSEAERVDIDAELLSLLGIS